MYNKTMKIRLMSDLHLEFYESYDEMWKPLLFSTDMFILAGDIFAGNQYEPQWLANLLEYSDVIYIQGNHEPYNNQLTNPNYFWACQEAQNIATKSGFKHNLYYGNNFNVIKDNVKFICSTMWTDFDNENYFVMQEAQHGMNDYNLIRVGENGKKLKPYHIAEEFKANINFITAQIDDPIWEGKKCVVTHHAPCSMSSLPIYKGQLLNHCYYKDLPHLLEKVNTWVHGHMHNSSDYVLYDDHGMGRVICNPRGYEGHFNPDFIPDKVFDL